MANNPYSPPTADVAERPDPRIAPGPMPLNVKVAVAALTALELYVLHNLHFADLWERVTIGALTPLLLVINGVTQAIYCLAILFVALRRNWARILEIVLSGWTLLAVGMSELIMYRTVPAGTSFQRDVWGTVLVLLLLVARGGATGLLFTPSANAWFRPRAAR
jgi:hypothetical protein